MHASALAKNRSIVVGVTAVASRGEITRVVALAFHSAPLRGRAEYAGAAHPSETNRACEGGSNENRGHCRCSLGTGVAEGGAVNARWTATKTSVHNKVPMPGTSRVIM